MATRRTTGRTAYDRGRSALDRALTGEQLTPAQQRALDRLQADTGARRPLTEYAPRTRRRYLAQARAEQEQRTERTAERRERATVSGGRGSRADRIEELRSQIADSGLDRSEAHSEDAISDLTEMMGAAAVERLLRGQLSALLAWTSGDTSVGRARWEGRRDEMERLTGVIFADTDPYFFYHGVAGR